MDVNKKKLSFKVVEALNSIRPFLKEDGGNINLVDITDDMVVKVEFQGACTTCTMNNMTFKAGVEEAILKVAPEVRKVEAINI